MKLSIIVPAFNEEKLLAGSLAAMRLAAAAWTSRGWAHELIVCDNNSTDRTAEVARAAGATVVFEPVNQISRARNRGAAVATGEWLVFVDADSYPTPGLFAAVADCIVDGRVLAGGSVVRFDCPERWARFWTAVWNRLSRLVKWVAGSFLFVEASAFRELGGFSEELFVSEEIELSRRLKRLARRRGRRMVILHRHPLETSPRKVALYGRRELQAFFLRAFFRPQRVFRDRAACAPWYDGRR